MCLPPRSISFPTARSSPQEFALLPLKKFARAVGCCNLHNKQINAVMPYPPPRASPYSRSQTRDQGDWGSQVRGTHKGAQTHQRVVESCIA